jgi:hypothetical protein
VRWNMNTTTLVPSRLLRRADAARYVSDNWGYPCSPKTLAKYAVIGGGPRFRKAGRYPLYQSDDLDAWVNSKLSKAVTSTSALTTEKATPAKTTDSVPGTNVRTAGLSVQVERGGGRIMSMTLEQLKADDAAWFAKHGGHRKRVRRAAAAESAIDPATTVIVVSQIVPGVRIRQGLCVPNQLLDFVLRNGDDCIGFHHDGEPFFLIPGCEINGKVLR